MPLDFSPLGLGPLGLPGASPASSSVPFLVEAGRVHTFTATAAVTRPAVAPGDLMVLFANSSNSDSTIGGPAGWTEFFAVDPNSAFNSESRLYWKLATESEPTSYTVTVTGQGGGSNFGKAAILVWRGVDQTTPIQTSDFVSYSSTAVNSVPCPTVTVAAANSILVSAISGGSSGSGTISFTAPGGTTEILDNQAGSATTMFAAFELIASPGATGTRTFTPSSGISRYHAYSFVIAPAEAAGTGEITATLSSTLAALTSTADGTVDVTGAASPTLAALTATTAGSVDVDGIASSTLAPLSLVASGTVSALDARDASLTATLGALTGSATGDVDISASATRTLSALTGAGVGDVDVSASATRTLAALTATGVGDTDVAGSTNRTLAPLTVTATGAVTNPGEISASLNATLGAVTATATGDADVSAAAIVTLAPLTVTGSGTVTAEDARTGSLNATLGALSGSGIGDIRVDGSAAPILAGVTAISVGDVTITASANVTLSPVTTATVILYGRAPDGGGYTRRGRDERRFTDSNSRRFTQ